MRDNFIIVTDSLERERHFIELGWESDRISTIDECLEYLMRCDELGFDAETTGLSFATNSLWCIQLGDGNVQFIIDLEDNIEALQRFKSILETKLLVGQNLIFDLTFMYAQDIKPLKIYDTLLAEQCLSLGVRNYSRGLGALIERYCKVVVDKTVQANIAQEGLNSLENIRYSATDVKFLLDIKQKQLEVAKRRGVTEAIHFENKFCPVLAYVEWCGLYLDTDEWYKLVRKLEYEEYAAELELNAYLESHTDVLADDFNWASSAQVGALFRDKFGIDIYDEKMGRETVTEGHLLKQSHEIIDMYLHYKKKAKAVTTYGRSWFDYPAADKRIHTKFKQLVSTGRMSCGDVRRGPFPNCVSMDTEVLTLGGWKMHDQITIGDTIATWSEDRGIFWDNVVDKVQGRQHGLRIHKDINLDIICSVNHRTLSQCRKTKKYRTCAAENLYLDDYIPTSGTLQEGGFRLPKEVIQFNVMTQADGHITKSTALEFSFSKKRKVVRCVAILNSLNITYSKTSHKKGVIRFYIPFNSWAQYGILLTPDKTFNPNILYLDYNSRKVFIDELFHWGGLFTRKNNYASSIESNIDIVQAVASITNKRARKRIYCSPQGSKSYQLDFSDSNVTGTANHTKTPLGIIDVWCVTVPSGYFLARRGPNTFITGNCQNIPSDKEYRRCFKGQGANTLIVCDYSAQEGVIMADKSREPSLLDFYNNDGGDIHSYVAREIWKSELGDLELAEIKEKHGDKRQLAKAAGFAISFGGTGYTIANNLNIPPAEGERVFASFMTAFPKLSSYFDSVFEKTMEEGNILIHEKTGHRRYIEGFKEFVNGGSRDKKFAGMIYRMSLNTPVQATAALMTKQACINLLDWIIKKKKWGKVKIVNIVHDEIIVECNQRVADKVAPVVQEAMESAGKEFLDVLTIKAVPAITKVWLK